VVTAILKVNEQQLKIKAESLQKKIEDISALYKKLDEEINHTKKYWQGDAADCHKEIYESWKDEVQDSLKVIKEYPEYLLKIAGNYEKNEKDNSETIRFLSTDVIS